MIGEGKEIVVVVEAEVEFPHEYKKGYWEVPADQIAIESDAARFPMTGAIYTFAGLMWTGKTSFVCWPRREGVCHARWVFLLPPRAPRAVTLHVMNASASFELPAQIQPLLHPADGYDVSIRSIRRLDHIEFSENRMDGLVVEHMWRNPKGGILEVKIEVSAHTQWMQDHGYGSNGPYLYTSSWFGGRNKETTQFIHCMGERFGYQVTRGVSHNLTQKKPEMETLYFAVPASVKDFELLMLGKRVAEAVVPN